MRMRVPVAERIWSKVDIGAPDECWPWNAYVDPHGYGRIGDNGSSRNAHRVAYEVHHQKSLPLDVYVDHVCHNEDRSCPGGNTCQHRRCINPAHMAETTHAENVRNGRGGEYWSNKTHCKHGHEFTLDNLETRYLPNRVCKTCHRYRMRMSKRRRRAATVAGQAARAASKEKCPK